MTENIKYFRKEALETRYVNSDIEPADNKVMTIERREN
jgi:hypothetical protein